MEGFINIHRKITDNKNYLSEPFTRIQAWIDLLILATHKDRNLRVKGQNIELKRGQLCWSIKSLAERWQWSQGKVDRYLNELETERQTVSKNIGVTTLISILNYDLYQTDGDTNGKKTGRKRGGNGEQTGTNNNEDNNSTTNVVLYSEEQKNSYDKFIEFIKKDAPDVMKMREPFTIELFLRITEKYPKPMVASVVKDMHNSIQLLRKYKSAYRTCESWCRLRIKKEKQQ